MKPRANLLEAVLEAVRRGIERLLGGGRTAVRGVDVVVPVYDAREDTERCLASVLRHGSGDFRLVVVDDASNDPTLVARLEHLAADDARVVLLRNDVNLGFVKSANRGMMHGPDRDVLLLNSDTEVPAAYLDRLRAAAAHTPRTGVVSPLTNDGTILSVPEWMTANPLPEGLDLAAFDALIAATSARLRPEIVTAHGFCMLIRREVLDAVGAFDEVFGRGYGEENDLCERAKAAGFEIRACDDLFVWHRGSASFAGETESLRTANLGVLGRRHPRYHEDVQRFIRENPLAEVQASIRYQLARAARRRAPALLMVLHADPFTDPRQAPAGGTQLHVLDLVRALALPRVVVAWPEGAHLHASEVADGDVTRPVAHRFPATLDGDAGAPHDRFALADAARERGFAALIDRLDVGAAHLHHLSGWPARIWRVLEARGIPFAYTVHDYLCTCPAFYRLNLASGASCACIAGDAGEARHCLDAFFQACALPAPADALARIREHRAEFRALLTVAAAVIAPSDAARAVVADAFPSQSLRWQVIPHALPVAAVRPVVRPSGGVLRVALLGTPSAPWKGSAAVLEVMRATRDLDVHWHVFGDAGAHGFPEAAAAAIGSLADERLHLHGRYGRDDVVCLLAGAAIDVTLILSPWPETFSYTLSESWAAGVPAIVLDRGAPAARVRATGAGIVVGDQGGAAAALRDLVREPSRLRALAEAAVAAARREPSPADNAARHRAAYGTMLERVTPRASDPPYRPADRELFAAHQAALREE